MKNLLTKLLLTMMVIFAVVSVTDAQILGKNKMPIGVKFYEVEIVDPETQITKVYTFADVEGQYDVLDFKNLDTSLAVQKRSMVYDDKIKTWRLPLNSELTGIIDPKKGPLPEQYFDLGGVRLALRHRVE